MRFPKPKQVDFQESEAETVGSGRMSRILGISRQHLSDLARVGRVPTTIVGGARRYDVDRILALASRCPLPFPPLRRGGSYGGYHEDALWACEALGRGPWNCPTAPTGVAWRLYLDAKDDGVLRRRLMFVALKLPERMPESEPSASGMPDGDGEFEKLTPAARALQELDTMDPSLIHHPSLYRDD